MERPTTFHGSFSCILQTTEACKNNLPPTTHDNSRTLIEAYILSDLTVRSQLVSHVQMCYNRKRAYGASHSKGILMVVAVTKHRVALICTERSARRDLALFLLPSLP